MSVATALARYFTLVPAHARVPGELVEEWLTQADGQLSSTVFGDQRDTALIWWAAHKIQRTPGIPGLCNDDTTQPGVLTAKNDNEGEGPTRKGKTRTYAAPASTGNAGDDDFRTTIYGQFFLDLRRSRGRIGPRAIQAAR